MALPSKGSRSIGDDYRFLGGCILCVSVQTAQKEQHKKKSFFFLFFFYFVLGCCCCLSWTRTHRLRPQITTAAHRFPTGLLCFFPFFVCVCAPTISDVFLIFFLFEGIFFFRIFVAAQGVLFYWRRSISKRIIIISALARVIRESGFHSFLLGLFASSPIWFAALKRKNSRRFVTFSHPKELESNIMAATIFVNWVSCRLHIYLKLSLSTKWRV